MATANHVLLRRITVTSAVSSVTFDSIPQTGYTDLKLVASARSTANGGQNMNLTFNSTTSGYSDKILSGNGSTASSFSSGNTARGGSCVMPGADFTANTFGNGEIYIPNYTKSVAKSFSSDSVSENNTTTSYNQMQATLWNNTAAITSILIDLSGGSFATGSSFSLYGLADVNTIPLTAPKADGGDIIKTDGTYWYHAFTGSGIFKPQVGLTCDILQVAGGGGSGTYGGGGGAGGVLGLTNQTLTASTSYTCAVGAGGAGGPGGAQATAAGQGKSGSNSQVGSLTAAIGGGGGGVNINQDGSTFVYRNGLTGGSGGGAGPSDPGYGTATGGAGTSGQGYAGGAGSGQTYGMGGGGGGGAGAVGAAGAYSSPASGGTGSSTYSSWASLTGTGQNVSGTYYFAGGGGGYANYGSGGNNPGGSGGGGAGNANGGSSAGTANTGGGAGAGQGAGAVGGSGIIIIRYPVA